MGNKHYIVPQPILNKKEDESLNLLTKKYEKMIAPGRGEKIKRVISNNVPVPLKKALAEVKDNMPEIELIDKCMKKAIEGFGTLVNHAAKITISERDVVKKVDATTKRNNITSLDEVCLARSYEISRLVSKYKTQDLAAALVEGGATGYFGFAGLPANIVLSTFLYFRAVQSVAMFYGYDVKNDSTELMLAGDVFVNALSPKSTGANEVGELIGKVMVMAETTALKQASTKTWAQMAEHGGIQLLIVQIRALANKAAQKALEKAGEKGLEETIFKNILQQIGKKLTKKAVERSAPIAGALIGGLFDVAQMNTVLEYADIFYNKRFILEKEVRINNLINGREDDVIDVEPEEIISESVENIPSDDEEE